MIEWWAYLCDILTFYNERIANQAYLGTADLPESVNRLIFLLGYRPRPGIGATGTLAALATGPAPFTLPAGFQVQSKPGPGQQPQIFELADGRDDHAPDRPARAPTPSRGPRRRSPRRPRPPAPTGLGRHRRARGDILARSRPATASCSCRPASASTRPRLRRRDGRPASPRGRTPWATPTRAIAARPHDVQPHRDRRHPVPALADQPVCPGLAVSRRSHVRVPVGTTASTLQVDLAIDRPRPATRRSDRHRGSGHVVPAGRSLVSSTEVVWYANPVGLHPPNSVAIRTINPAVPPPPPAARRPLPRPGHPDPPYADHLRMDQRIPDESPDSTSRRYLVRYGWKDVGTA